MGSNFETQHTQSIGDGFSALMDGYTEALSDNSAIISAMLEELTKRDLSSNDFNTLKGISNSLKRTNNNIGKLGK